MIIDWEKVLGIGVPLFISALVVFLNWRDHFHKESVDTQSDLLVQYNRLKQERDEANKRGDLAELALQAVRDVLSPVAIQEVLEAYERKHSK
jgi:hypothetical protein